MLLLCQNYPFFLAFLMLLHLSRWSISFSCPLNVVASFKLVLFLFWPLDVAASFKMILFLLWTLDVATSFKMILFRLWPLDVALLFLAFMLMVFHNDPLLFLALLTLFLFQDWSIFIYGPPHVVGISLWSSSSFGPLTTSNVRLICPSPPFSIQI